MEDLNEETNCQQKRRADEDSLLCFDAAFVGMISIFAAMVSVKSGRYGTRKDGGSPLRDRVPGSKFFGPPSRWMDHLLGPHLLF